MGQPMAAQLLDAGHRLVVLDTNPDAMRPLLEQGAGQGASPKDLADRCEVVVVALPTLAAFRAVVFGPDGLLLGSRMRVLVNTCTVGAKFLREVEAALAPKGVAVVDAPISGGPAGARAGTLSVMVSGDPAAIELVRPLLTAWGPTLTVAGEHAGAAQVLKLTNNVMVAVSLAVAAEAFTMGAKGGLDPEVMLRAISAGVGNNAMLQAVFPRAVLTRDFNFGAALSILVKDLDLAMDQSEDLGVPMWLCQTARLIFKHAAFSQGAGADISTVVKHIESGAGFAMPKTR
jgi:2-hydroxy-3-oxopropionate reductase